MSSIYSYVSNLFELGCVNYDFLQGGSRQSTGVKREGMVTRASRDERSAPGATPPVPGPPGPVTPVTTASPITGTFYTLHMAFSKFNLDHTNPIAILYHRVESMNSTR